MAGLNHDARLLLVGNLRFFDGNPDHDPRDDPKGAADDEYCLRPLPRFGRLVLLVLRRRLHQLVHDLLSTPNDRRPNAYAGGPYSAWKLAGLLGTVLLLLMIPGFTQILSAKIAHGWLKHIANIEGKFMVALQFIFAVHILTMIGMLFLLMLCVSHLVAPMILEDDSMWRHLDDPLTARIALCWVAMIGLPLFSFKHIALPSLRDTNQVMNGHRDRVRRRAAGASLTESVDGHTARPRGKG